MRIKGSEYRSFPSRIFAVFFSFLRKVVNIKTAGILLVVIALFASTYKIWDKGVIEKITRNMYYILQGWVINPPDRLTIDMKFKHYQKLVEKRNEAIKNSFLLKSEDDYVPASVTYKGKKVDVKLRLKGDYVSDHLTGEKWSFRIVTKGDGTILGMKKFSIHRPSARYYLSEWVFHRMLRREGLIAIRYDFINVTLNGKDLGLYALEEHLGKHLIENSAQREGVVIQYEDVLFYEVWAHQSGGTLDSGFRIYGYPGAEIKAYQMNRILKSPTLTDQFKTAIELAGRFRTGELTLSQVFDIPKLATYYALTDLTGAQHNTNYSNFKMYYNPVTSKLEPIGFDASNALTPVRRLTPERFKEWAEEEKMTAWIEQYRFQLWEDEQFTRQYLKELERVTRVSYVDQLVDDIEEPTKKRVGYLWRLGYKEGKRAQSFPYVKRILYQNAKTIRDKLNVLQGIRAYYAKVINGKLFLHIANIETIPLEIEQITYKNGNVAQKTKPFILQPRKVYSPIDYRLYEFALPDGFVLSKEMIPDLVVHYNVPGTAIKREVNVIPWDFPNDDFFKEDFIRRRPNFEDFGFLVADHDLKTIIVKPGRWDVDKSIIIPAGWQVLAKGETTLNLRNGAAILSYSPFRFIAGEDDPIVIESKDWTGQGIAIIDVDQPSIFQYVIFRNLSNPHQGGWSLLGAVNFYQTKVEMAHCQFLGNNSEDSLNIIRSDFSIEDSLFKDTSGDAIDFDFAKGEIKRIVLINSGNDALDFSGSVARLSDVVIRKAGDKGISIGEASQVQGDNLVIDQSPMAVAGKDSSVATLNNVTISRSNRAFAVYQKKPEYGPASLKVSNLILQDVYLSHVVEARSTLIIDNKAIGSDQAEVEQFLRTVNSE